MSIESKPISLVFRMPNAVPRPAWTQAELIRPSFMMRSPRIDSLRARRAGVGAASPLAVGLAGEPDGETAPLARGGLDVDGSAMLADDAVADREAEAGPLAERLGGEERVEDPLADRRARCRSRYR